MECSLTGHLQMSGYIVRLLVIQSFHVAVTYYLNLNLKLKSRFKLKVVQQVRTCVHKFSADFTQSQYNIEPCKASHTCTCILFQYLLSK